MAKIENLKFLANVYISGGGNKERTAKLYEELLSWLFGDERTIEVCAQKAYRDIQRNLRGIGEMLENDKQLYRNDMCNLISSCIDELLRSKVSFDVWHKDTCDKICSMTKTHNVPLVDEFTYGLAQKWLNMTLKNMLVMELYEEQLNQIKKDLHIPVDSYILEAASKYLEIDVIDKTGENLKPYKEGVSKPWSKWNNYEEYLRFQHEVREAVTAKGYECPMDWEFSSWLEIKDKRG